MKISRLLIAGLLLACLYSCSSRLDEKTVRNILESSLKEDNAVNVYTIFFTGEKVLLSGNEILKYKKLEEQGFLTLDSVSKSRGADMYFNIRLTEKAGQYIDKIVDLENEVLTEINRLLGEKDVAKQQVTVRVASFSVSDIENIHEIPAENRATAKVTVEKTNRTPFWILSKDTVTRKKVDISFIKTTDNNWKVED
jgi:hypothetical protein